MTNSYTTQFFRVSNGEITTHNPRELVGSPREIEILSAEVQWEGVTTSEEVTEVDYENNETDTGYGPSKSGDMPPPPSGYSFLQHFALVYVRNPNSDTRFYDLNVNLPWVGTTISGQISANTSEQVDSFSTVENYVGDPANATFESVVPDLDVRLLLGTQGSDTVTKTEFSDTQDPRVTRDVLGESGGVTLNDGEQSSWYSLEGLGPNPEEFFHDIDGSGESRFRFRFDWEEVFPDVMGQMRVYDSEKSVINKVALADPVDSRLDYNHIRVSEGGTTYAVDVVDPSDPNALSWFKIQTHKGVVSPRVFDKVPV